MNGAAAIQIANDVLFFNNEMRKKEKKQYYITGN